VFVVFGLVKSCGAIVVFPCCRRWCNNLNEPLDSFPFWVAAEQKGGQGWGWYIAGLPSMGRDSSPPRTFYLWYTGSHSCAESIFIFISPNGSNI